MDRRAVKKPVSPQRPEKEETSERKAPLSYQKKKYKPISPSVKKESDTQEQPRQMTKKP
jgi:hypothetical protein